MVPHSLIYAYLYSYLLHFFSGGGLKFLKSHIGSNINTHILINAVGKHTKYQYHNRFYHENIILNIEYLPSLEVSMQNFSYSKNFKLFRIFGFEDVISSLFVHNFDLKLINRK